MTMVRDTYWFRDLESNYWLITTGEVVGEAPSTHWCACESSDRPGRQTLSPPTAGMKERQRGKT